MKEEKEVKTEKKSKLIALRDFKFKHGEIVYEIKKGNKVEVPKMFFDNLKTEKVIK